MIKKLGALMLLASVSWGIDCPKGSSEGPGGRCYKDYFPLGVKQADAAKWVSDEKPPRNVQPAWETGAVVDVNYQNTDVAFRSPPDTCKGDHKVWTGAHCHESEPPAGRKPK